MAAMGLQESNNEFINLEEDQKHKPKTEPQIGDKEYAKWLTDRYNKKCAEVNKLHELLKVSRNTIRQLKKASDSTRLKYMNDKQEFSRELMKDNEIRKYKNEIANLHKCLDKVRQNNKLLITENLKLKNNG